MLHKGAAMSRISHRRSDSLEDHPAATRGRLIRWANSYDPFVSLLTLGRHAQLRRTTVALARVQPGETVLEVGCGTGDVSIAARAQVGLTGAVSGIDAAPEMIAVARAKVARLGVAVDFQVGLIEALTFPAASFDVVLSSLMMHHLPDDLKRQGLAEIARVLKPAGRLLVVDFKRPTGHLGQAMNTLLLHGGLRTGVQDLPPMLHAAGFTDIDAGETEFRMLGFVRGQTRA
jgi:ubiquinone/menaquinone biosynthesis C-methylase UbiE